jgi:hypothetical protein
MRTLQYTQRSLITLNVLWQAYHLFGAQENVENLGVTRESPALAMAERLKKPI